MRSPLFSVFSTFLLSAIALGQVSNSTTTLVTSTPLTTLSSTSITSTSSGPISIPSVSTTTGSNGQKSIIITQPTAPMLPNPTEPPEVAGEYKLRVQTLNGPQRFNGQYLAGYTIYANSSADPVFTTKRAYGAKFFVNGTLEEADFGTGNPKVQWSMSIVYDYINAEWYPVSLRAPQATIFGTFFLNGTGLQWTPNETPPPHTPGVATEVDAYFGGWVVCDWWHSMPQLFYRIGLLNVTRFPDTCADVLLLPEYFK